MRNAFLLSIILAATAAAESPKNVIFLIADDLGMEVGCYGDKAAKTPNIDALAKAGTRFTKAFASVSSCSPSRATMLTGQPSHMNGMYGLAHAKHNFHSFAKGVSLPGILNTAGYETAVIAKHHVQPESVYPFKKVMPVGGRNGVAIAAAVKKCIQDAKGKPFFLHVGYSDPHRAAKGFGNDAKYPAAIPRVKFDPKTLPIPYHLPDADDVRGDLAEYYMSVARLDFNVGLVRKVLDETKTADTTLICFFSDNGIPFAGAKSNLYDAGVHLPMIVVKPGQKPGVVNDMMVSFTDLAPTVLDWCGLSKPDAMPGKSFLPFVEAAPQEGWDEVYGSHQFHEVTMYYPMRMVRTAKYKLIQNLANDLSYPHASDLWGSPTWQGVLARKESMMGERSVSQYLHRPKEELYDLTSDPHELTNLAGDPAHAEALGKLSKKLHAWRVRTNDPWLIKDKHE